ncbi:MAG: hypothetical protein SGILL_005409, partial [Bacillariaceae sp.]
LEGLEEGEEDDGKGLDGFQAVVDDDDAEDDDDKITYSDDDDGEEGESDENVEYEWEEEEEEYEEEVIEEDVEYEEEYDEGEEEDDDDDDEWEYVYEDDLDREYIYDSEAGLDEEFFEDEAAKVPIRDYPEDPKYGERNKLIEEIAARRKAAGGYEDDFDPVDYLCNDMTAEEAKVFDNTELQKQTEKEAAPFMVLGPQDVENLDIQKELSKITDLYDDDPHIPSGETDYMGTGVTDDDMKAMDDAWKSVNEAIEKEPWNKVDLSEENWHPENVDNQTRWEMAEAIRYIEGSSYEYTKWLKYDLGFNVTNLMLAAVKHNPDAPVFLMHWYAQLLFYSKYKPARDINFAFTHEDVQNADIEELERYYLGFGYDEIPNKAPGETGLISVEEMDEEEIKMASFESWMKTVYNPEWDKLDFDDEDLKDENNVFSDNFVMPNHPDLPSWEDAEADLEAYNEQVGRELDEDEKEYRDFYGKKVTYTPSGENGGLIEDFRGHLVIACGPITEDINTAEKITARIVKEFGDQVYPETRIMSQVIEDDNVFEVWLESYEVDLLHSRRRNFMQALGWDGPADVDDAQLDYLVEEIRDLTSEDSRICERYEEFGLIE